LEEIGPGFSTYSPSNCLEGQRLGSAIRMDQTRVANKFLEVSQKVEESEGPDCDGLKMWRMIYENCK
jgi:hypothetical protein